MKYLQQGRIESMDIIVDMGASGIPIIASSESAEYVDDLNILAIRVGIIGASCIIPFIIAIVNAVNMNDSFEKTNYIILAVISGLSVLGCCAASSVFMFFNANQSNASPALIEAGADSPMLVEDDNFETSHRMSM